MKLFDLDKWERDGHEELASAKKTAADRSAGRGEPRTWILITTAICLIVAAAALLANGALEGTERTLFNAPKFFYVGGALFGLVGIAYIVGIVAGRTAATDNTMSFGENALTMVCSALIALVSVALVIYHFTI